MRAHGGLPYWSLVFGGWNEGFVRLNRFDEFFEWHHLRRVRGIVFKVQGQVGSVL